jgi:hypothetical protein
LTAIVDSIESVCNSEFDMSTLLDGQLALIR